MAAALRPSSRPQSLLRRIARPLAALPLAEEADALTVCKRAPRDLVPIGYPCIRTTAKVRELHTLDNATSDVFASEITDANKASALERLWKLKDEPLPWKVEKWDPYHYRRQTEARRVPEDKYGKPDEMKYMTHNFPTNVKKLRHVANLITGMMLDDAIKQLEFCKKLSAETVATALKKARRNAMAERKWNPFHVYIEQAIANKGPHTKELHIHGRGRCGILTHPTSHLRVVLKIKQRDYHYLMGEKPKYYAIPPNQQITRRVVGTPALRDNQYIPRQRQFYNW